MCNFPQANAITLWCQATLELDNKYTHIQCMNSIHTFSCVIYTIFKLATLFILLNNKNTHIQYLYSTEAITELSSILLLLQSTLKIT